METTSYYSDNLIDPSMMIGGLLLNLSCKIEP